MSNKIFNKPTKAAPATDTVNSAGGIAYSLTDKTALAKMAVTSFFGGTYYASGMDNLNDLIPLCEKVDPEFLAKTLIYSRVHGKMRDSSAYMLAVLSRRDPAIFAKVFDRVIQGPGELRTFVQVCKSGKAGRTNVGTVPRRKINEWFARQTPDGLFRQSIGSNPSMGDILNYCKPKPETPEKFAVYRWLKGRSYDRDLMPESWKALKAWEESPSLELPRVPIEMLDQKRLGKNGWIQFLRTASWKATLRNLAKASEAKAFDDQDTLDLVCKRLTDPDQLEKAQVFPYALLNAYLQCEDSVPNKVKQAIHDAMEIMASKMPAFPHKVAVCVDVSGSMSSPITRSGRNGTTARCIDAAALVGSIMLRRADDCGIVPFENRVVATDRRGNALRLRAQDSIITNAEKLASIGGGGTDCSVSLRFLNDNQVNADLVLYVSDNESWMQYQGGYRGFISNPPMIWTPSGAIPNPNTGTGMANEWRRYKQRVKGAKLAMIDLTPSTNSQIKPDKDVLLIGGFSDSVWTVLGSFMDSNQSEDRFVAEIEKVEL